LAGRFPEGMVYFPESFREPLASVLAVTSDPVTGVPYHKLQPVTVSKAG
jgi:formylmethanofuran dehydrogenase subunit D